MEWIIIAYVLALVGLVPIFGRISDVMGRKRLFLIGLLVFTISSALVAASHTIEFLVGFRVLQGVGAAIITANVLEIVVDVFPEGKRGLAMGFQTILVSGGAASGPTVGGLLVDAFGWEAVFLINVPIGLGAAALAAVVLPPLKSNRTREPIDWLGAFMLVLGLVLLLIGLSKAPDWGWGSGRTLGLVAVSLVIFSGLVRWERQHPTPLVDGSLFRIRAFTMGQIVAMSGTVALATSGLLLPFYWQTLQGHSPSETGLLMVPIPVGIGIMAPIAGRISDR